MPATPTIEEALLKYTDEVFYYGIDIANTLPLRTERYFKPILETIPSLHADLASLGIRETTITEDDFHDSLFTSASYADLRALLVDRLTTGNSVSLLQAPPGWGKSSFLSDAVRTIQKHHKGNCITINFKQASDLLSHSGPAAKEQLVAYINTSIATQAEHLIRTLLVTNTAILAHTLAGIRDEDIDSEPNQTHQLVYTGLSRHLNHFSESIRWAFSDSDIHDISGRERRISAWTEYLSSTNEVQGLLASDYVYQNYYAQLNTAQLLSLLMAINPSHPTAIIYDNIDNLELEDMAHCNAYAISLHNNLNSLCKTLVAVRTVNVIKSSAIRRDSKGALCYPIRASSYLCPPTDYDIDTYHARTQHALRSKTLSGEAVHLFDYIVRRCDFSWSTLDLADKATDDPRRRTMLNVIDNSARLAECLLARNVSQVANQNMRSMASLFIEFLQDLYRLEHLSLVNSRGRPIRDIQVSEIVKRPDSVETRFYIWLHSNAKQYGLRIPDVVMHHAGPPRSRRIEDALSLQHLIISGARNLRGRESRTYPDLLDRLDAIGFDREDARQAIKQLAAQETPLIQLEYSVENEPTEISITPLGDLVVTRIFSGVGYTLSRILVGETFVEKMTSYLTTHQDSEKRKLGVLNYLNTAAVGHLCAMELLYERSRSSPILRSGDWLQNYIAWFCIDGTSQIERQFNTAARFYGSKDSSGNLLPDMFIQSSLERYLYARKQIELGKSVIEGKIELRALAQDGIRQ